MAEDLRRPASPSPQQPTPPGTSDGAARPKTSRRRGRTLSDWAGLPWVWVTILVLTAGFQYFRGAPADSLAFAAMALLLAADALNLLTWLSFRAPVVPRILLIAITVVVGLVVVVAPIESAPDRVTLILVGAGLFVVVWPDPPDPDGRAEASRVPLTRKALARAGIVWGAIAVAVCIWELTNFFLGLPSATATEAHPTISSLIEPFVSWPAGRIAFVAVWLCAGLALLRKGHDR